MPAVVPRPPLSRASSRAPTAFEIRINALIHRDYLIEAPIRLFVFRDRIEIVSPGHLPNNLTIEKIRTGNSNIRNPILASYVAKGVLPYHGIGSGIKRALADWPDIAFTDDRDGCLFTATVKRKAVASMKTSGKTPVETPVETPVKTPDALLDVLRKNPAMTLAEAASATGKSLRAVERACAKLITNNQVRHIGPRKGGHWEVAK